MPVITSTRNLGVDDLVNALCCRLQPLSDGHLTRNAKGVRPETVRHDVRVLYHTKNPQAPKIKFTFVTPDYMVIDAVFEIYNLNLKGREYIADWYRMVLAAIEDKRAERMGEKRFVVAEEDPMRAHIRNAIGEMGGDPDPILEQADRWAQELVGEEKLA
jgi:hypothetical protein